MNSVFINASYLFIHQIFNYLAPLLILPYLTRILAINEFGAVMVALSGVQLAFVVTDYGFGLSATYMISKNRNDRNYINSLIARIFSAKLLLLLIASVIIIAVSFLPSYYEFQSIFLAGILAVVAQAYQPVWLFQGLEKMRNYTGYMVLTKVLHVAAVFIIVRHAGDGTLVLISWFFANFIGMVISLVMVKRLGYTISFSKINDAIFELKATAQFFWSRISVALFTCASSILVGTSGLTQAALFSSAEQAYKAGQNITSPISQAFYPYLARDQNWTLFIRMVSCIAVIMAIGSFFVSYYGTYLITLVFGPTYLAAKPILDVFMLVLVINYISVNFGYPACAAIDRPDIANRTVIIGSVLHGTLLLCLLFSKKLTAYSVVCSILITETVIMILRVTSVYRARSQSIISQKPEVISLCVQENEGKQ